MERGPVRKNRAFFIAEKLQMATIVNQVKKTCPFPMYALYFLTTRLNLCKGRIQGGSSRKIFKAAK
jgi:hypothetical protein